jgi:hypothetical protein
VNVVHVVRVAVEVAVVVAELRAEKSCERREVN